VQQPVREPAATRAPGRVAVHGRVRPVSSRQYSRYRLRRRVVSGCALT
jgi:hypothetical protein